MYYYRYILGKDNLNLLEDETPLSWQLYSAEKPHYHTYAMRAYFLMKTLHVSDETSSMGLNSFTLFFFWFAPSSLIILVNISLCYTIYCIFSFYFSLTMISHPKHVLSSLKTELQKHGVVHQSNILLRTATKPWKYINPFTCFGVYYRWVFLRVVPYLDKRARASQNTNNELTVQYRRILYSFSAFSV